MKTFDILLGYYYFRKNHFYLNIVKDLAAKYRVGILLSDEPDFFQTRRNNGRAKDTDRLFRKLCVEWGAEPILVNEKAHARLFLIPLEAEGNRETPFTPDYVEKMSRNISWNQAFGFYFFMGSADLAQPLRRIELEKRYVLGKSLFLDRAARDGARSRLDGVDVKEIGDIFKKHPAFPGLSGGIDYLVAYPSPTHYDRGRLKEKYLFIKNVHKLLGSLPAGDKVVLKYHNLRDEERLFLKFNIRSNVFLGMLAAVAALVARISPFLKHKFYSFAGNCLHTVIVNSYPAFDTLTPYHNFPIELFLPAVKKGVISGYSITAFGALAGRVPYYNCDPRSGEQAARGVMDTFSVAPCHGELRFDPKAYEQIPDEYRQADLVEELEQALQGQEVKNG